MSTEHDGESARLSMTEGCYFFLTFDHHSLPSDHDLCGGGISVTLSKYRAGVTEMDISPAPHTGAGKLFFCFSPEWERRCQTLSEQELKRNMGFLARLFPDDLAAIQHGHVLTTDIVY